MTLWEPHSGRSWAHALGLAYAPLFGPTAGDPAREHAVLLDGTKASFHFVASDDLDSLASDDNLEFSWSANLLYTVAIDRRREMISLRRWDAPDEARRFRLPTRPAGANQLLDVIRSGSTPRSSDVVLHLLRAFRAIRAVVPDPVFAVRLFNLCLTVAALVEDGDNGVEVAAAAKTFHDLQALVSASDAADALAAIGEVPEPILRQSTGVLLDYFLSPEPQQQYRLRPSLLLRHASGQLYQEAHLVLEREQSSPLVPGSTSVGGGELKRRDVRFTPRTLARAVVEQSLATNDIGHGPLRILDPACGSGIFLLETVRELVSRNYTGSVALDGIDISEVSASAASFCLFHARAEAIAGGMQVETSVRTADALKCEWGEPNIVLMNPPFATWESMTTDEQGSVRELLGEAWHGRSDKAMAFVTKAVETVPVHGVVASILPAPLLESSFGEPWREALAEKSRLTFVGKFTGFGYFRASLVEPAFIVLERRDEGAPTTEAVTVLLSESGYEDEALRSLRLYRGNGVFPEQPQIEIFTGASSAFPPSSWTPRRKADRRLIEQANALPLPRVNDLFEVKQGTKTGSDKTFILKSSDLSRLPEDEQRFFRPVASSGTIREGRLIPDRSIFFPYGAKGLMLRSEADLEQHVPIYYELYLRPAREKLQARTRVSLDFWWKLTWEREWQHIAEPKIVSATWGDRGSFAYDQTGEYVVVQGLAWLWRRPDGDEEAEVPPFRDTNLPWAYLALLNSDTFERFIAAVAPRVQGGQFNLSLKFVGSLPLPDLSDEASTSADVVAELSQIGRSLHEAAPIDKDRLDILVGQLYGIDVNAGDR